MERRDEVVQAFLPDGAGASETEVRDGPEVMELGLPGKERDAVGFGGEVGGVADEGVLHLKADGGDGIDRAVQF